MIGNGVFAGPGVTTTTGGAAGASATGDGVPRMGANLGGFGAGAAVGGGPTAIPTGPGVGATLVGDLDGTLGGRPGGSAR
jgi:hypothetical protein